MIKEAERYDKKVLTIDKPITAEVWEYLEEQVEQLVNSKVRTLKTLIIPNEKAPEGANSLNGASGGILLELLVSIGYANFTIQYVDLSTEPVCLRTVLSKQTWVRSPYPNIKNTLQLGVFLIMGRLVGFEPTHIGTTIRGLNRLTTDAI